MGYFDAPLRLRRDAAYFRIDGGIFFRTRNGSFRLKGETIYHAFQTLVPYFDGNTLRRNIIDSVSFDRRSAVSGLIELLLDRAVIQAVDVEDQRLIDAKVAAVFEDNIEFLAHITDEPNARFLRFRDARILVAGNGGAFVAAGRALLRNGLRTLHLLTGDRTGAEHLLAETTRCAERGAPSEVVYHHSQGAHSEAAFDLVLYCSERPDISQVHHLNLASTNSWRFLPAIVHDGRAWIGPLVEPGSPACWLCAALRWSDNASYPAASAFWQSLATDVHSSPTEDGDSELFAQMLGNAVALESFRFFTDAAPPEARAHVLVQDVHTLETARRELFPHEGCKRCAILTRPAPPEVTKNWNVRDTAGSHLDRWASLINHDVGLFSSFSDESLEQLPLRVGAVERRGETIFGWSIVGTNDARVDALMRAMKGLFIRSQPVGLRRMSSTDADSFPELSPERIVGHFGAQTEDSARSFLIGVSATSGRMFRVPAGAVHPALDVGRNYDADFGGIGAGRCLEEARERALLSLLEHHALMALQRGTLSLVRWNRDTASGDDTTKFLMASASAVGLAEFEIGVAWMYDCGVATAILVPHFGESLSMSDIIVGSALSAVEAINAVLTEMVARNQLAADARSVPRSTRHGILGNSPFDPKVAHAADSYFAPRASLEHVQGELAALGGEVYYVDITPIELTELKCIYMAKAVLTL